MDNQKYGACFIGFPQAEKVPETYTDIIPYALAANPGSETDPDNWSYLGAGAKVKIWIGDDDMPAETAKEYDVSTDSGENHGRLTGSDGTPITLTLIEDQEYNWQVTPAEAELQPLSGKISATKSGDTVFMYAQQADAKKYTLTFGDGSAKMAGATVTVTDQNGATIESGTTDFAGNFTFEGYPGLTYNVEVSKEGFATVTGTVTTNESGIASYGGGMAGTTGGTIVLPEKQTTIRVTVKYMVDDEEHADQTVANATVSVTGAGSFQTNASGVASVELGAGTYSLRAMGGNRGAGAAKSLEIKADGTVLFDGAPVSSVSDVYNVELRVGAVLSDPLYRVVGTWVDDSDHSKGMTFTVSVENVSAAIDGTFGFQWDSKAFKKPSVVYGSQIDVPSTDFVFTNPVEPVGGDEKDAQYQYHSFYWQAAKNDAGEYIPLAGTTVIATYTMEPATGVTDIDSVLNDKTVMCRSFLKTSGAAEVNTKFDADSNPDVALASMSAFWQNVDQTDFRNEAQYQLDSALALDGGFYQIAQAVDVIGTVTDVNSAGVKGQDIMMVIEYPSSNIAVKFNVHDPNGNPVVGAKVTLQDEDGNPVKDADGNDLTGETDAYGDVTIQVPATTEAEAQEYYYSVKKAGFKKYPDSAVTGNPGVQLKDEADPDTGELPDVIDVEMEPDGSAKVFLNPNARVNLLGSNRAPMEADYLFNVEAKPGYTLKAGGLQTTDFEIKIWKLPTDPNDPEAVLWTEGTDPNASGSDATVDTDSTHAIDAVYWDSTSNNFMIKKEDIKVDGHYLIEIIVKDEETNVPETTGYKVTAKADAAGGFFTVDPVADGSTFTTVADTTTDITASVGNKQNATIETLKAGGTSSSTYQIGTNGPVLGGYSGANATKINAIPNTAVKAANGQYYGYVINELYINGVAVSLTDPERIHGVDETLVSISEDQSIVVTYMIAKIDAKDTDNPADDEIIEESDPVGDALVTVVLGEHGTAKVSYDSVTMAPQAADTTANYTVSGADFSAEITAASGVASADPTDTNTTDYEIDKIYVVIDDGAPQCIFSDDSTVTVVTVTDVTWTGGTAGSGTSAGYKDGTVAISNLASGKHVTILATFKTDGADESMQAWVQTVNVGGNGNISPSGLNAYNVGAEPVFIITPDAGWSLATLTVNGSGRKSDATDNGDGTISYKMEPLAVGTTDLGYSFAENAFRVKLKVHYGSMTASVMPYTHAKIAYERTAGGDGTANSGVIVVAPSVASKAVLQEYTVDLTPGTWTITVTKNGYLPFTITDFTIKPNGAVDGTKVTADAISNANVIDFGVAAADGTEHYVAPRIGDADWSQDVINLRDITQLVNGMSQSASAASKAHADMDESASWTANSYDLTDDYAYVLTGYGAKASDYKMSYADFLANSRYAPSGS